MLSGCWPEEGFFAVVSVPHSAGDVYASLAHEIGTEWTSAETSDLSILDTRQ
jgi:hypothetical protein